MLSTHLWSSPPPPYVCQWSGRNFRLRMVGAGGELTALAASVEKTKSNFSFKSSHWNQFPLSEKGLEIRLKWGDGEGKFPRRLIRSLVLFKRKKRAERCLMLNLSKVSVGWKRLLSAYSGSWGQLQNITSWQRSLSKNSFFPPFSVANLDSLEQPCFT